MIKFHLEPQHDSTCTSSNLIRSQSRAHLVDHMMLKPCLCCCLQVRAAHGCGGEGSGCGAQSNTDAQPHDHVEQATCDALHVCRQRRHDIHVGDEKLQMQDQDHVCDRSQRLSEDANRSMGMLSPAVVGCWDNQGLPSAYQYTGTAPATGRAACQLCILIRKPRMSAENSKS